MCRRTGSCYKHSITAEKSTASDSSYITEGFRLQIRFVETGLGGFVKENKSGKWANQEGSCSTNLTGEKECKSIRKYRFFESIGN